MPITIHKRNDFGTPIISLILLDWSCRERFHTLDWLSKQNVPREQYELIWVELYNRVVPEVMEKADVVITCGQKGLYHKHVGYNVGLLHSKGQVITICDSDAGFPPDFIDSIICAFNPNGTNEPKSIVLMHYQWRSKEKYPEDLADITQLTKYFFELWPNVGACMSVRRIDAVRFGGFDEHPSFRGYLCGPYDLGWRLVNATIPEIWHDEIVALWHFAHPDPTASFSQSFSLKRWRREIVYPHIDYHALTAVEAFSTGRLLPLKENPEVHKLRMAQRRIGTSYEERYARMTGLAGFSKVERYRLQMLFFLEPYKWMYRRAKLFVKNAIKKWIGPRMYGMLKGCWHFLKDLMR